MMSITEAEDLEDDETYEEAKAKHDAKILKFQEFFCASAHHKFEQNPGLQAVVLKRQQEIGLLY